MRGLCLLSARCQNWRQSRLGRWLAAELHIPYVSLDEVYWSPGWKDTPADEFRAEVTAIMEQHPDGWIIDGDYKRAMKDLISGAATDIICKDHAQYPNRGAFT